MRSVYIVAAARSPIGRFCGAIKDWSPAALAAPIMQATAARARVETGALDLIVFGNVLRGGHGQLIPRQAALKAGIPATVDAMALDMVCASGMMSVITAAAHIRAGDADLVLAGGVESMSSTGFYVSSRARNRFRYVPDAVPEVTDLLFADGLTNPITGDSMGEEVERLMQHVGVTRTELDEVAVASHCRAAEATRKGMFEGQLVPLEKNGAVVLEQDEGIRADTTLDALTELRTVFRADGLLTAGNSSQISDGAAALLLASGDAVRAHGLRPMARLLASGWVAGEAWRFAEAPVAAVKHTLQKAKMAPRDVELFENNEAFALSSILFHRGLGIPFDRINVHGGAIALGHPIGCSGARILVTLLHALEGRGASSGAAAICHGTGGATAVAVERM